MPMQENSPLPAAHSHVFLGAGHAQSERKAWAAIGLTSFMMAAEIVGGSLFGSLAVVADGLHMATHAIALLIAALAYTYARTHAHSARFAFGTGKLGDLAGYSSAIVLAMVALLILYQAVVRFFFPVTIHFSEAIPIAAAGLCVNVATAWLLSGDHSGHSHGHGHHGNQHEGEHGAELSRIDTGHGILLLEVFEEGVPPRFRLRFEDESGLIPVPGGQSVTIETERPDGSRQQFSFADRRAYLESVEEIPEPHEFAARVTLVHDGHAHHHEISFVEHGHDHHASLGNAARDNNMRAAFVHVLADAAVSVLAIAGLLMARYFGWIWMDPAMGIVGSLVIANWAWGLARDTGGILTDMTPDSKMVSEIRNTIEADGDHVNDLHLWRLGPGHLGAIVSVQTERHRGPDFYRARLGRIPMLSHVTIEVQRP